MSSRRLVLTVSALLMPALLACAVAAQETPAAAGRELPDLEMRRVETGSFVRGMNYGESAYGSDYDPSRHRVQITRPFLVSRTEVTQRLWAEVMDGANPSAFPGGERPVESVSWYDAIAFCVALSERAGLRPAYRVEEDDDGATRVVWNREADGYRLLTEAEWEYAARAGRDLPFASSADADAAGWNAANAGDETHEVATKAPNAWGLYDMSGNVSEWVFDAFRELPPDGADPFVDGAARLRVFRGGSVQDHPEYDPSTTLVVAHRAAVDPLSRRSGLGLRLARSLPAGRAGSGSAALVGCDAAQLAGLDAAALRLRRNEVFARHGRPFQAPDLREHFERQPWYRADPAYTDLRMTDEDRACLARIAREEQSRSTPAP